MKNAFHFSGEPNKGDAIASRTPRDTMQVEISCSQYVTSSTIQTDTEPDDNNTNLCVTLIDEATDPTSTRCYQHVCSSCSDMKKIINVR